MKTSNYINRLAAIVLFTAALGICSLQAQPEVGLEIDTATSDGIRINGAGDDGIQVLDAKYGIYVFKSAVDGVLIDDAGRDGIRVTDALNHGVHIIDPSQHGMVVDGARIGLNVKNTLNQGILIENMQGSGIDIDGTGGDGISVINASGLAGNFTGNVSVSGTLTKGMGTFKIDHPLDPENKFLYHSFVESPDMMNIYNGVITLDNNGEAAVKLPSYFKALNRDFRYQLTPIGSFAPLYVKAEISGNAFSIAGGQGGMRVSWQVTGVRKDPLAEKNRVQVEVQKSADEQGLYLHPQAYDLPPEKSLSWKKDLPIKNHTQISENSALQK